MGKETTVTEVVTQELSEAIDIAEQVAIERKEVGDAFDETLGKVNADQEALRIELEQKEAELFQRTVAFTLREHGLEVFAGIIHVTDAKHLTDVVTKLTGIVNGIKIESGYIPKDNVKQDATAIAEQNKDPKGMIASKFSKLFK